jgi:hypothetical protein
LEAGVPNIAATAHGLTQRPCRSLRQAETSLRTPRRRTDLDVLPRRDLVHLQRGMAAMHSTTGPRPSIT